MNVMIIGNGGREHALAWKAAQSPLAGTIFVVPGNAGTATEPGVANVELDINDVDALIAFANENAVGLTIIGPEAPLVNGIVDRFHAAGLTCFGPTQAAAQLEGSKAFTKDFLARYNIPTARYAKFSNADEAIAYVRDETLPIVIKADGLAAGKGVVIAETMNEAEATIRDMLAGNSFGEAGHRIVIEEFMQGEEASFIALVDGETVLPFATSQDHKARDDGDQGPNTGGMGAYSPAPVVSHNIDKRIMERIILPTVRGMAADGHPYTGFLYAGLMIDAEGNPRVVEYNCRFGDPEAQPIMMRLKDDLIDLCLSACRNTLSERSIEFDPRVALGVVMAAGGYPGSYQKGATIEGLETADTDSNTKIFHAGTRRVDDHIETSGGRVLCITALGNTTIEAQTLAYEVVSRIHWDNAYYRKDIGHRAIAREKVKDS